MTTATAPNLRRARGRLRRWWQAERRDYSWRNSVDPYAILVAEVLLQKTQVAKAAIGYDQLMRRCPTLQALNATPAEDLLPLFQWLGLPKRLAMLKMVAAIVTDQLAGQIPENVETLESLPGVGRYTAHAVACFGFGSPVEVVDSATGRVIRRFFGLSSVKPAWDDPPTWKAARTFLDHRHPTQHNYALIDLAAGVCRTTPRCRTCPLAPDCAYAAGLPC
jgi:A/G-specific adenine glycosylase